MRRRPARRGARRGRDALGVVLIGLAGLVLLGLGLGAGLVRGPPVDPETGCRTDQPPAAHTIILVDATDRLSPRHKRALLAAATEERQRLARHDRLSVFLLDADDPRELQRLFSACDPGDGRSVNPLIANPRAAQERWEAGFAEPLQDALNRVNGGGSADWSPIVEALAAAAADPTFSPTVSERRIVLSTDLLEHHPGGFSLFQTGATFEAFAATPEGRSAALDLTGVSVRVLTQDHPDRADAQHAARDAFWAPLMEEAGAESVTFDPSL